MSMSPTVAFRSRIRGCSTCLRLNASSWPVSAAARSDARLISSAYRRSFASDGAADQELAVAGDRREQVVEVVGDAAGEPADRLHLLRLAELRLDARDSVTLSNVTATRLSESGNALTEKMRGRDPVVGVLELARIEHLAGLDDLQQPVDERRRDAGKDLLQRAADDVARSGARSPARSPCWRSEDGATPRSTLNT